MTFKIDKKFTILEAEAIDLSNTDNHESTKILLQEPKNFGDKEMKILEEQENNSEIIEFPGYENIRNKIVENQTKLESLEKKDKYLNLDIIKDLLSLILDNMEETLNKINIQICISYIKYIFSLTKIYLKNNYISYEDCTFLKIKLTKIFKFLQFLNEENNYNITYQDNNKKYHNIFSDVLFELLEDIYNNQIIYDYCLSIIIESYNSKMKEYYFGSDLSDDFEKDLLICKNIQNITKKLLNKIRIPNAIPNGVKTEIILYELKIDIKKFLLNYKNKNKIDFDEAKIIASDFINKIENTIFFNYEIEKLNEIAGIQNIYQGKLKDQNDMIYLYDLIKFKPPKRNMKYQKIKSKEDILKELENNENLDEKDRESYINKRLMEEKAHRKINDYYYNKINKYCYGDYQVRYYFLDDPFVTIIDLITIYDKSESSSFTKEILKELNLLKNELRVNIDEIDILLKGKSKNNYFKFYNLLLEEYPPVSIQHDNPRFPYEWRENKEYISKINFIKEANNIDDNCCNDKKKFEYFEKIYMIYQISYLKSKNRNRKYLSVLGVLNKIKKKFEKKNYLTSDYYEKKILD